MLKQYFQNFGLKQILVKQKIFFNNILMSNYKTYHQSYCSPQDLGFNF